MGYFYSFCWLSASPSFVCEFGRRREYKRLALFSRHCYLRQFAKVWGLQFNWMLILSQQLPHTTIICLWFPHCPNLTQIIPPSAARHLYLSVLFIAPQTYLFHRHASVRGEEAICGINHFFSLTSFSNACNFHLICDPLPALSWNAYCHLSSQIFFYSRNISLSFFHDSHFRKLPNAVRSTKTPQVQLSLLTMSMAYFNGSFKT